MKHPVQTNKIASVTWFICVAFLCVMAGVWAGHYKWSINRFYDGLEDFAHVLLNGNQDLVNEKIEDPVTSLLMPEAVFDGYTLLTHNDNTVLMFDANGKVIHRWKVSYEQLAEPEDPKYKGRSFTHITNTHLFENGNMLVIFHNYGDEHYGRDMALVDKFSRVIWSYHAHVHDSMTVSEDNIYVLTQHTPTKAEMENTTFELGPTITDAITVLSLEGKKRDEIPLLSSFLDTKYEALLYSHAKDAQNYMRAVSIERLSQKDAEHFPMFKVGDLLVSFKHMHTIAVIRPETKKVIWAMRSIWRRPDDAVFTPNGSILVYDSDGMHEDSGVQTARIVEVNPDNTALIRTIDVPDEHQIDDGLQGSVQYLPNQNILVSIANQGQIYELNPDGNVVWKHQRDNIIYSAQRVAKSYVGAAWGAKNE